MLDHHHAPIQMDLLPGQAENIALAQTSGQGKHDHFTLMLGQRLEELLRLGFGDPGLVLKV